MSGEDEKAEVETPEVALSRGELNTESEENHETVTNGEEESKGKDNKKATKRKVASNKNLKEDSDDAEDDEDAKKSLKKNSVKLPKKSPSKKSKKDSSDEDEESHKSKSTKPETPKKISKDDENDDAVDQDEEMQLKKEVPLLDQPLEVQGSRERKKVARFEIVTETDDKKTFSVPEGKGTKLGDIPSIEHSISRMKPDIGKFVSKALFGNKGPLKAALKKSIRSFNGYDFEEGSEQWVKRATILSKLQVKNLKAICEILCLEKSGTMLVVSNRIMQFCSDPKDSEKKTPQSKRKSKGGSRKSAAESDDSDGKPAKSRSKRGKGKRTSLKDVSESGSEEESMSSSNKRAKGPKRNDKINDESPADKDKEEEENHTEEKEQDVEKTSNSENEDNKDDGDESDAVEKEKPAAKKKKTASDKKSTAKSKKLTAKKPPAKKKDESDSEFSSSDDEVLISKTKTQSPPSDEDIKAFVKKILEGANLEEITMKTVCRQVFEKYPDHDLSSKKDLIKETVKSLIST